MNLEQPWSWRLAFALVGWLALLALLPWWVGLSFLLALVALLLLLETRLPQAQARRLRWGLRWGLPGVLFALQRALGGDVLAWTIALLGALVGYMLVVGLELWLDRGMSHPSWSSVRAAAGEPADAEWPERMLSSTLGPPVELIELDVPDWHHGSDDLPDPWGHHAQYRDGGYQFIGARRVDDVVPSACFSPDGRWFAARIGAQRGVVLWDRRRDAEFRLRRWQLAGWYREQPWLQRTTDAAPCPLAHVLGNDEAPDGPAA